jgi:hypothetical protein
MTIWNVARAKARLSELLDRARVEPQTIQRRRRDAGILVAPEEFARLRAAAARAEGPMKAFLELTERLKREGALDLRLPRRRARRAGPSPFEA